MEKVLTKILDQHRKEKAVLCPSSAHPGDLRHISEENVAWFSRMLDIPKAVFGVITFYPKFPPSLWEEHDHGLLRAACHIKGRISCSIRPARRSDYP